MKRISRLVLSGSITLALIQPVSGLAFGSLESDLEKTPLLLPPLAEGLSRTQSLKELVPPGLLPSLTPVYRAGWGSVAWMAPTHATHQAGDRIANSTLLPQPDFQAITRWSVYELQTPDARGLEQTAMLEGPDGGDPGEGSAVVTVPEPMGRTLLSLGLAGLCLRRRLGFWGLREAQ